MCRQIRPHPLASTSASSRFSPPLSAIHVSRRPRPRITTTDDNHLHVSQSQIIQDMGSRGGKLAPEVNRSVLSPGCDRGAIALCTAFGIHNRMQLRLFLPDNNMLTF